jgi:hypothetical protein
MSRPCHFIQPRSELLHRLVGAIDRRPNALHLMAIYAAVCQRTANFRAYVPAASPNKHPQLDYGLLRGYSFSIQADTHMTMVRSQGVKQAHVAGQPNHTVGILKGRLVG